MKNITFLSPKIAILLITCALPAQGMWKNYLQNYLIEPSKKYIITPVKKHIITPIKNNQKISIGISLGLGTAGIIGYKYYQHQTKKQNAIIALQSAIRGYNERKYTTTLQSVARGYLVRKEYEKMMEKETDKKIENLSALELYLELEKKVNDPDHQTLFDTTPYLQKRYKIIFNILYLAMKNTQNVIEKIEKPYKDTKRPCDFRHSLSPDIALRTMSLAGLSLPIDNNALVEAEVFFAAYEHMTKNRDTYPDDKLLTMQASLQNQDNKETLLKPIYDYIFSYLAKKHMSTFIYNFSFKASQSSNLVEYILKAGYYPTIKSGYAWWNDIKFNFDSKNDNILTEFIMQNKELKKFFETSSDSNSSLAKLLDITIPNAEQSVKACEDFLKNKGIEIEKRTFSYNPRLKQEETDKKTAELGIESIIEEIHKKIDNPNHVFFSQIGTLSKRYAIVFDILYLVTKNTLDMIKPFEKNYSNNKHKPNFKNYFSDIAYQLLSSAGFPKCSYINTWSKNEFLDKIYFEMTNNKNVSVIYTEEKLLTIKESLEKQNFCDKNLLQAIYDIIFADLAKKNTANFIFNFALEAAQSSELVTYILKQGYRNNNDSKTWWNDIKFDFDSKNDDILTEFIMQNKELKKFFETSSDSKSSLAKLLDVKIPNDKQSVKACEEFLKMKNIKIKEFNYSCV